MREEFRVKINALMRTEFNAKEDIFPPGSTYRKAFEVARQIDLRITLEEVLRFGRSL